MKARFAWVATLTCLGSSLLSWQVTWVHPAVAGETALLTAASTTLAALGDDGLAYVGSNQCKTCHRKQYKSWKKGKKFNTLALLLPGDAIEIKKKYDLDPQADYSKDERCLQCHTTGFGHEGGYTIPNAKDEKAVRKMRRVGNVGCESCHGPGSQYISLHQEIMTAKRKYKSHEIYAKGLRRIGEQVCLTCHNNTSPTHDLANPFDFATMKDHGGHDHFPLKLREE